MSDRDTLAAAVTRAVRKWCEPGGAGGFNQSTMPPWQDRAALVEGIVDELEKLPEDREVRTLRYRYKQVCKQLGKQGARIYELRCRLAEARSLIMVDANIFRSVRDNLHEVTERSVERGRKIKELEQLLQEKDAKIAALQWDNGTLTAAQASRYMA